MKNKVALVVLLSARVLFATQQVSDFSGTRAPNVVTYRGVTVDTTAIVTVPNRDAILDALRGQIDIVNAAAMSPEQKAFLKSVPIILK